MEDNKMLIELLNSIREEIREIKMDLNSLKEDLQKLNIETLEKASKDDLAKKLDVDEFKKFKNTTQNILDEKHYKHIGVIAQEVEKEAPEIKDVVLHGEDDEKDMLVVEYGMFTPYLIKAVQELNAKVKKLEARIKELENNDK